MEGTFVIVGGGIAGVSCVETLAFFEPEKSVILLSESSLIKTVTNLHAVTKMITEFDVEEKSTKFLSQKYKNVTVLHDTLTDINDEEFYIKTKSGKAVKYQYLCLCTGAEPKFIPQHDAYPDLILGIRDTDSVETFVEKLQHSKKVMVVGNGGIASELVYKIKNAEIDWVIKDKHISATFVDPGAAEFFQDSLKKGHIQEPPFSKRIRYTEDEFHKSGAALGPDWYKSINICGGASGAVSPNISIHYEVEIASVTKLKSSEYALEASLTNGEILLCDLIVSATGVSPKRNFTTKNTLDCFADGGINVNLHMKSNLKNIYAAGDICNANWPYAKHWFQMKLWTQARQMGAYAAKCMAGDLNNEEVLQDFCFEIFTHSTKLFGYKVILLGLYNGQKLGRNYEILLRMTKGHEYVKLVIENHKLQGAVLIGDTDLEEMCENLILNQLDLEQYGDDILNPDIDIEDYFD